MGTGTIKFSPSPKANLIAVLCTFASSVSTRQTTNLGVKPQKQLPLVTDFNYRPGPEDCFYSVFSVSLHLIGSDSVSVRGTDVFIAELKAEVSREFYYLSFGQNCVKIRITYLYT